MIPSQIAPSGICIFPRGCRKKTAQNDKFAAKPSPRIFPQRGINMALISGEFLTFCLFLTIVYYAVPGKFQNALLLAANVLFLLPLQNFFVAILFLGLTVVSVYAAARFIESRRGSRSASIVFAATILLNLGFLFAFKYLPFAQNLSSVLHLTVLFPDLSAAAPLGISFYTLQLLGYLINVNDGGLAAEHSLLRFAVFGSFFPQITSGPISRYENLAPQIASRRNLSYANITRGAQRMLWGFFKKLVISERAAIPVNTIFGNYGLYNGFYIPFSAVMFAVQLYCDFSGCMDIAIGVSEILGIRLPENFISPFFSRSMTEFWRRWHITLGTWCKDYVFYPIQKSDLFYRLREKSIHRYGRKNGKKIPMYLAMFLMWFVVGFWHGGFLKYIIGSGLLHFTYIFLEQEGTSLWNRVNRLLHIHTESAGHIAFQRIRTFLLVCSGFIFFRADSFATAIHMYAAIGTWNLSVFSMTGLTTLGLDLYDILVLILSILLLGYVETLQQRGSVRSMIAEQSLLVRWFLFLGLFFCVLILGEYGSGFHAESFIYANF